MLFVPCQVETQVPKKGRISSKPKGAEVAEDKKPSAKKKEGERSKVYQYQYPYGVFYVGQQWRYSKKENMTVRHANLEYSPYADLQPQGYWGRPTYQPRQLNSWAGWAQRYMWRPTYQPRQRNPYGGWAREYMGRPIYQPHQWNPYGGWGK